MKIRPLQDRVLVQRTEGEEKTAGGITPLDVSEGDRVLFGKYAGSDVRLDGEDYVILREDDILAVLDSKKKGK